MALMLSRVVCVAVLSGHRGDLWQHIRSQEEGMTRWASDDTGVSAAFVAPQVRGRQGTVPTGLGEAGSGYQPSLVLTGAEGDGRRERKATGRDTH